jgi:uncharacterized protein (UPF0335 family)
MANAAKKKPLPKPAAKKPLPKPVAKAPAKLVAKAPEPKAAAVFAPVDKIAGADHNGPFSKAELKKIVDNIESLEEKKVSVAENIKDAYTVAKSKGFDTKAIRDVLKIRAADKEKLKAHQQLRDLYLFALDPELADVLS